MFQAEFFSFASSVAFIVKMGFAMCFWKLCNNDLTVDVLQCSCDSR